MSKTLHRNHPDEIYVDGSTRPVRVTYLDPDEVLSIRGRTIRVGDIPLSLYTLECGHKGKGIAVQVGNTVFCDTCQDGKTVVKSRS